MLRFGQAEVDAVASVVKSGKLFRYCEDGQCQQFERRWAQYVGQRRNPDA